jgi:DNA-binding MarR family transcriptional regulator
VVQDRPVGRRRIGSTVEDELARAAAFRTALRRFLRRTDAVAAQFGLTPQRYDLLLMVGSHRRQHGAVRMSELCELLQLQQTAVTELVKRAERAGLIRRRPSPQDGRVWLLEPTEDGEARMLRVFEALREDRAALAEVFRDVDERFRAASR